MRKFEISFKDSNYDDIFNLVKVLNVENDVLTGIFQLEKVYIDYFDGIEEDIKFRADVVVRLEAKINLKNKKIERTKLIKCKILDMSANAELEQEVVDIVEESICEYYDVNNTYSDDIACFSEVEILEK